MGPMMKPNYADSEIKEAPTLTGPGGRAWLCRLTPVGQRETPDHDGTVCCWLVNVPMAHPFWSYWFMACIHLRPIAGVKEAHKEFPEATHEFMIHSLNPDFALPSLDIGPGWKLHLLTPADVVEQFQAENDAVAAQITEMAARAIVNGQASPDSDWRRWWHEAVRKTAQHYLEGKHYVA